MSPIGVGVIGGSIGWWAAISHLPALAVSAEFELRAVSTSRRASAQAAAAKYGVAGYDNYRDLIADPGVELVVVSVKVPEHAELISAVLAAGKMVYSEWPLAGSLAEASRLAEQARTADVRTVAGLQARYVPEVRLARDLIHDGYIGEVLGTTLVGSGMVWGGEVANAGQAYWYDATNGVSPLSVSTLHTLEALQFVLGEFDTIAANLVIGRKQAEVADGGEAIAITVADQVAVIGTLTGGAAASVFYRGGASRGDNFRWEINGTEGDLVLTAAAGSVQVAPVTLAGGRGTDAAVTPIEVPASYHDDIAAELAHSPAANVARLYRQLARDLAEGTHTVPDFEHALTRHRLIDVIERASATGTTQRR